MIMNDITHVIAALLFYLFIPRVYVCDVYLSIDCETNSNVHLIRFHQGPLDLDEIEKYSTSYKEKSVPSF